MHVAFDEARMNRRALGIDDARGRVASGESAAVAHVDDPSLVDGDRAVLDDAALIIHGDDIGIGDEQLDLLLAPIA